MRLETVSSARERFRGVRAVYTDLDGTMLGARASFLHGPDGAPTMEPARALLAAQSAGIAVVPVSGRALRGLITDGRLLHLPDVIAEMGAQLGYDYGAEVLHLYGQTPGDGPPAQVMRERGAIDLVLSAFDGRLELLTPWAKWRECTMVFRGQVDPAEVERALTDAGHDWLAFHDNGKLHGPHDGPQAADLHAYHLQPKGVSKGAAVAVDRERRGLDADACVAIGDSIADLELAPEVATLVLVRQAVEAHPELAARAAELPNVVMTDRPQNLGWADTLALVAGAEHGRELSED